MRLLGWPLGHERQRELLSAYLDAQLSPRERHDLERHLESCAACRAELDGLRATVTLLRAAPPAAMRRSFTLTPAMAEAEPPRPLTFPRPTLLSPALLAGARYASAAAAVLLLGVVSYDITSNVMTQAPMGVASQASSARTFDEQRRTLKAAPAPMPAGAPMREAAPGAAPGGAAGGGVEGASAPEAPEANSVVPPTAPNAEATPEAAPAADAATAMMQSAPAEEPAAATMQAQAPGEATPDEFGYGEPQRAADTGWIVRWLEAALAAILVTAIGLWWWGRRPA